MLSLIGSRSSSARIGRTFAACAALAITFVTPSARADEPTDYCQRVTARAEGDAALLFAPTLAAQLIRYPNAATPADTTGLQIGDGVQPRAAVSIGLVDIYKGFGVLNVAKADCQRQQSFSTLEVAIAQRADVGRLDALEHKLAFFRERRGAVEELVRNGEERFAAQTATLAEVQELRLHALQFERNAIATEREIAVLKARATRPVQPSVVADELKTYEKTTVDLERRISHVRNVNPWRLNVTAGVTASPSVDAFGVAELSYNFGGLIARSTGNRAVQARESELKKAPYEMRQQVDRMGRELLASAEQSRAEAKAIGAVLERMARDRKAVEATDAPNKRVMIAAMTLSMIDLEAEQTFLSTLAEKQTAFAAAK